MTSNETHPFLPSIFHHEEMERRRSVREVCKLTVTCRALSQVGGDSFPAIVHDISTDGIGLWVDQRVAFQTLKVELHDQVGTYSLSKLVRVKHVGLDAATHSCLGGMFVKKLSQNELG